MELVTVATTLPVLVFDISGSDTLVLAREALDELRTSHPHSMPTNVRAAYRSPWHSHRINPKLLPLCEQVIALARTACVEGFGTDLDTAPLVVSQCWVIDYQAGDSARAHHHFPALFGAAVYLEAEGSASPMVLGDGTAIEPRPGRVLLFPGVLRHAVPEHAGGTRTVVSMNLRLEWGAGRPG